VATKFVSERNIRILLYEVFDIDSLTQYDYFSEHNRKTFDVVLKATIKLGKDLLYPVFAEMDRDTPELIDGQVKVHPSVSQDDEGVWRRRLDLQSRPV
jgi:butyryl-CoA dehydrogenase